MKPTVCISGLGHIGLPMATLLTTVGYQIHGVDTNEEIISKIQSGKIPFYDPELESLLKNHPFEISNKPIRSDIHIIAVPTPLGPDRFADLSYVHQAIDAIGKVLRKEDLVLIESTCPIGTTRNIAKKFPYNLVAYCPERVLPGNLLYELIHNDRVVGGVDPSSTEKAVSFYRSFTKGNVFRATAEMAEGVKLAENAYRDVNLAFANELSMISDQVGLDVNELIHLANKHPRVNILNPGVGVGGHCIAVDPWFLVQGAPKHGTLISHAREINDKKSTWVLDKIRCAIKEKKAQRVACLGLTYKANVTDLRKSPALAIAKALENEVEVLTVDPFVEKTYSIEEGIQKADIIAVLVPHDAFRLIPQTLFEKKVLLDFVGVFA